jgi:hypothetical protein
LGVLRVKGGKSSTYVMLCRHEKEVVVRNWENDTKMHPKEEEWEVRDGLISLMLSCPSCTQKEPLGCKMQ